MFSVVYRQCCGRSRGPLTRETMAEMMMVKSAQPDWTFKRRW
jgi:hypothetical protein